MNIWKHNHLTFISWESHNLFKPRPCWRRLVLAWERLTRWEQFKNPSRIYSSEFFLDRNQRSLCCTSTLLPEGFGHPHGEVQHMWRCSYTGPFPLLTNRITLNTTYYNNSQVLLHWATPSPPPVLGSPPTSSTSWGGTGRNMALALHVSEVARELQSSLREFETTQANPCWEECLKKSDSNKYCVLFPSK